MSIGTVYDIAYKGDFNQVKVKFDEDPNIIHKRDNNDRLLIHWAALGGNDYLVNFLIEAGSPVDPVDDTNATPLILAASAGRFEAVRILLGKGASVNHKTNRGQCALQYACSKGHKEIAKLLIEYEANINQCDVLGATPLHRASAQGRTEIIEILLTCQKLNINICDSTGSTPLHLACEEDREHGAILLVKGGADLQINNKDKKTPLDLCSSKLRKTLESVKSSVL